MTSHATNRANGVPEDGAEAWAQGWSTTASPHPPLSPENQKWLRNWHRANENAHREWCEEAKPEE